MRFASGCGSQVLGGQGGDPRAWGVQRGNGSQARATEKAIFWN